MADHHAYLVAGKRSPIGALLGGLSRLTAPEIGAQVARAVFDEAGVALDKVDDVFIGEVLQAGVGQNPARQVALTAGLPPSISATTVNKVCGSGLQAVMSADQAIRAGDAALVLAGGIESMTNAPHFVRNVRRGIKFGNVEFIDSMQYDGLTNVYDNTIMGCLGDYTAEKAGVSREAQDQWALQSHQRAAAANERGDFNAERVGITIPKAAEPFNTDETVRPDANLEKLAGLRAVFGKDGTVTAGNASAISDGAAMLLVASEAGLSEVKGQPLARIVAQHTAGVEPKDLFFAPIDACRAVCEKAGWDLSNVDYWEINEAFASQTVACLKALELDETKVNVRGGAIALGHPIGASGARVLVTLLHTLKSSGAKRGVASLCLGGGNAVALAVEAV